VQPCSRARLPHHDFLVIQCRRQLAAVQQELRSLDHIRVTYAERICKSIGRRFPFSIRVGTCRSIRLAVSKDDLQSLRIPLNILSLFVLCTTAWSRVLAEQCACCPSFSSSSTSRSSMQVSSASHDCDRQQEVTTPMDRQKAAVTTKMQIRWPVPQAHQ
jgi:hypothetical protein